MAMFAPPPPRRAAPDRGGRAQTRVLLAGGWRCSLRCRRLRRRVPVRAPDPPPRGAADRIAGGRFDEPVVDPAPDELGQLARAFERMRLRLRPRPGPGEFIANASHELRTPLFSLGGFLELLEDEDLDEPTRREFLGTMREQVPRLTKLATDLLDLSRLDAGRLRWIASRSIWASSRASSGAPSSAACRWTRASRSTWAASRAGARATPTPSGRFRSAGSWSRTRSCTPRRARRSGGAAPTAVEPHSRSPTTGPASPRTADAVFERFYRLDGTVASGSGLGLAIARELAELMGGRIALESRPGWTRFTLVLRSADAPRPRPLHVKTVAAAGGASYSASSRALAAVGSLPPGRRRSPARRRRAAGWPASASTKTVVRATPAIAPAARSRPRSSFVQAAAR